MDRTELEKYISITYGCDAEYPWLKYPDYAVYRHKSNGKWFAVVMDLPKSKFSIDSDEKFDVVNLKCDTILLGSLLGQKGFFPAYHMNKNYWVSVALDGSVDDDTLKWLLDMSFDATDKKSRR